MNLAEIKERHNKLSTHYLLKEHERTQIQQEINRCTEVIEQNKDQSLLLQLCETVLRETVKDRRDVICNTLALIGTSALKYALKDNNIEMQIEEKTYRDNISSNIRIISKDTGLDTPLLGAKGGGIEDIVNTAMRIGILRALNDPAIDGPIILDEPYKQLSSEYQPAIAEFLSHISTDFGRQIILSTHNDFIRESGGKKIHVTTCAPDTSVVTEEVENNADIESAE